MTRAILILIALICRTGFPASARDGMEFVFPAIPDSITDSGKRAEYVVCHFWDNALDADYTDAVVMETFFYALGKISQKERIIAVNNLIDSCIADLDRLSVVASFVDFHLGEPESPYRNDSLYLQSQRHIVDSEVPEEYKLAPRHRIELLTKNPLGAVAPDFTFRQKDGRIMRFAQVQMPCALVFAASECGRCRDELIKYSPDLHSLRLNGWTVLTVYLDGKIPPYTSDFSDIEVVADIGNNILENDIYVARRLPSVYLIDMDRKILEKELLLKDIHLLNQPNK